VDADDLGALDHDVGELTPHVDHVVELEQDGIEELGEPGQRRVQRS
jgi:hypothetical protein